MDAWTNDQIDVPPPPPICPPLVHHLMAQTEHAYKREREIKHLLQPRPIKTPSPSQHRRLRRCPRALHPQQIRIPALPARHRRPAGIFHILCLLWHILFLWRDRKQWHISPELVEQQRLVHSRPALRERGLCILASRVYLGFTRPEQSQSATRREHVCGRGRADCSIPAWNGAGVPRSEI